MTDAPRRDDARRDDEPRDDDEHLIEIPSGCSMIGILLILAGVLVFLQQGRYLEKTGIELWQLWPLVLVVIGVRGVIHTEGVARVMGFLFVIGGSALVALNLGFTDSLWTMVSTWFTENEVNPSVLIPIGLVLAGVFFVAGGPRLFVHKVRVEGDRLKQLALFGGQVLSPDFEDFQGGWLAAMFGGFEIDLRDSVCRSEVIQLDVIAIFGGGEIKVPPGWKIQMSGMPIFGGFSSTAKFDPDGKGGHPTLKVNGFALFGGYEITN